MCFYPNQLPIGILELGRFLVRYQTDSYYRHHGCLETTFNSIFLCRQKKKKIWPYLQREMSNYFQWISTLPHKFDRPWLWAWTLMFQYILIQSLWLPSYCKVSILLQQQGSHFSGLLPTAWSWALLRGELNSFGPKYWLFLLLSPISSLPLIHEAPRSPNKLHISSSDSHYHCAEPAARFHLSHLGFSKTLKKTICGLYLTTIFIM